MRSLLHITLGLVLATPAAALTPLPPCSGVPFSSGYEIWDTRGYENGFVSYYGQDKATKKLAVVLEHCKTGKALWSDTFRDPAQSQPGDLDQVLDVLDDYLDSDKRYTLKAIVRGMKRKDLNARQVRIKDESCACHAYFRDDHGNRKPYGAG